MNGFSKRTVTLIASAFLAVVVFAQVPVMDDSDNDLCYQTAPTQTDDSLTNHAAQCLTTAGQTNVSWWSWVAGKSGSFTFHYLDLLELLYRFDTEN